MNRPPSLQPSKLVEWIDSRRHPAARWILGITGPPGAGKSTLASRLAEHYRAPVVGMDGFHLAREVLDRQGTAARKGAPWTFDRAGFVSLLRRIRRADPVETVYAPRFDRDLEDAIAASVSIGPEESIVIVEGNYLLLTEPPWDEVRPLLDCCIFLSLDDAVRRERLVARHVAHGRTPEDAESFVIGSDESNAALVVASKMRADAIVEM